MNKNSILFFVGKVSVGGAGKMVQYVASICRGLFDKVIVVSFYDEINDEQKLDAIEYHSFNFDTKTILWRLSALNRIRLFVKENEPSICCSFVSDIAFMTRVATLKIKDLVFISAERGDPYTLPTIWKKLVSWTYNRSDYCIFQLLLARDFFDKTIRKKSFLIPNPYINKGIVPYYGDRKRTIVTATRFEKEKGVDLLIQAFASVHENFPDYKLIIYGAGSLVDSYRDMVKSLNIVDCVTFPGYINNVAENIREDGIFVLPSRYEGIPNTLVEVLSTGIPVISADCSPGGPRFLLKGGCLGLLFPVNDVKALETCIIKLITDKELYKRMQNKGDMILSEIAEPRIRKKWLEMFESLTKDKPTNDNLHN